MIGQTLSHYKIVEKLGEGGMGVVYKARDLKLERFVALKFLPEKRAESEQDRARLLREARAAAALNHPSICSIIDIDEHAERPFIVMEFVEGSMLRETLTHSSLPQERVAAIGAEIAEALAHAHLKGIIHRDIKPENIMLTGTGRIKIMDFGLARIAGKAQLTQTGTTLGTLPYMSPEQIQGQPVNEQSDIWSLGAILFEMTYGHPAFQGDYPAAILYRVLNTEPDGMNGADAAEGIVKILKRALAKNQTQRYGSAKEILEDLTSLRNTPRIEKSPEHTRTNSLASIAVLRFVNMSGDQRNDYLADGMAEELIDALAKVKTLKVVSRTSSFSFEAKSENFQLIRQKLNVEYVIEGSVRIAGERLRVTARLVDLKDGFQLWSETYDRKMEDVFGMQDDIVRSIVQALKLELKIPAAVRLVETATVNMEAYHLCLQGRFFWARRPAGLNRAIECFMGALTLDPSYAAAHVGLADCYNNLGSWEAGERDPREVMPLGRSSAQRALSIAPSSAEAYSALAYGNLHFDRNWEIAEKNFQKALSLNPQYSVAHHWYAHYLMAAGRTDEALRESRAALALDPLDLFLNAHLAWHHCLAREKERAADSALHALELDPHFPWAHYFLGWAYEQMGRFPEAVDAMRKSVDSSNGSTVMYGGLGHAYAAAGDSREARKVLEDLQDRSKRKYVASYEIGLIHLALGSEEQAFVCLERALDEGSGWLVYMNQEPRLDSIRENPRFQSIIARARLPH